jgi:hypothetical protein
MRVKRKPQPLAHVPPTDISPLYDDSPGPSVDDLIVDPLLAGHLRKKDSGCSLVAMLFLQETFNQGGCLFDSDAGSRQCPVCSSGTSRFQYGRGHGLGAENTGQLIGNQPVPIQQDYIGDGESLIAG